MQGPCAFPGEATDSSRFETRHIERDAGVTSHSVALPVTSISAVAIASLSSRLFGSSQPKRIKFAGHVRRNVEAHDHQAVLPPPAPSARALGAKGQIPGPHRDFPHRFRVCLTYAGRVAGFAWFPHARPHCRVQPGLRSYGLPEQARERGKSFAHRERGYHVTRARSTQASLGCPRTHNRGDQWSLSR